MNQKVYYHHSAYVGGGQSGKYIYGNNADGLFVTYEITEASEPVIVDSLSEYDFDQ